MPTLTDNEISRLAGKYWTEKTGLHSEDFAKGFAIGLKEIEEKLQGPGKPIPGKLYLMVGLPGSGKTTYAREYLSQAVRVCHDDLYRMMTGSYNPAWKSIYHMAEDSIITQSLVSGWDVVVDRTCLDRETRKRFIDLGKQSGSMVFAWVMTTPTEVAREMNQNPDRLEFGHYVSDEVFATLLGKFVPVDLNEGFNGINYFNPFENFSK